MELRVDVKNTGAGRLTALSLGGDLIGSHAEASLEDLDPGGTGSATLSFPFDHEWRPGRHVVPLQVRYTPGAGSTRPRTTDVCAYLVLQLATPAEPAVRVTARDLTLDLRGRLPVTLESADGRPHSVRVRAFTPRGLVAPDPPPVVDVPAQGSVSLEVPLLYGSAPRDTPVGVLVVAAALDGPVERMALATATVEVAPDAALLPKLRAPLALAALVLFGAGFLAEWRRIRPRGGASC